jgi:hypothetical protein
MTVLLFISQTFYNLKGKTGAENCDEPVAGLTVVGTPNEKKKN